RDGREGGRGRARVHEPRVHELGPGARADGARPARRLRGQVLQRRREEGAGQRAADGEVSGTAPGRTAAEAPRRPRRAARDDGAPGRIRTLDLPLRRRLLYPLSYWCTRGAGRRPRARLAGAGDGTRTRDIQRGRLTLYRLSYSRAPRPSCGRGGEIRTHDPLRPRQVRYQAALLPVTTRPR